MRLHRSRRAAKHASDSVRVSRQHCRSASRMPCVGSKPSGVRQAKHSLLRKSAGWSQWQLKARRVTNCTPRASGVRDGGAMRTLGMTEARSALGGARVWRAEHHSGIPRARVDFQPLATFDGGTQHATCPTSPPARIATPSPGFRTLQVSQHSLYDLALRWTQSCIWRWAARWRESAGLQTIGMQRQTRPMSRGRVSGCAHRAVRAR